MSVPDYQSIMLPLLKLAEDGQEHKLNDAIETLASQFSLTLQIVRNYCQAADKPSSTIVLVGHGRTWSKPDC